MKSRNFYSQTLFIPKTFIHLLLKIPFFVFYYICCTEASHFIAQILYFSHLYGLAHICSYCFMYL